jgi:hypothetical protein
MDENSLHPNCGWKTLHLDSKNWNKTLKFWTKIKWRKRGGPNWTCFAPLFWTLLGSFKLNPFYSIILNLAQNMQTLICAKLGRFKEEFAALRDGNLVPCSLPPPSSSSPTCFFWFFFYGHLTTISFEGSSLKFLLK